MWDTKEKKWTKKSRPSSGKIWISRLTLRSEEVKTADGQEKEITYGEYVEKINQRALQRQLKKIEAKRRGEL